MRLALRGTLAGWAVTAALLLLWPQTLVLLPAFLWTASFSLLMLAHITAFTVRALATPRSESELGRPMVEPTTNRREFFSRAATASTGAVLLALFGRQSLVKAASTTPQCGRVSITVTAEEANCPGAMAALRVRAVKACKEVCASQVCPDNRTCRPGFTGPRDSLVLANVCCEEQEDGSVKAIAVVPCDCFCPEFE